MQGHSARFADEQALDVPERGVVTTLSRSAIEEAARGGDGPVELVLDIARSDGRDVLAHSLTVGIDPADLERLLSEDRRDEIAIAFDRDEMEAALQSDADVEAHGLREKALILTIVAVSAGSSAAIAQAHPSGSPGGGTVATASAPATTIGGATGAVQTAGAPDVAPAVTTGGATAAIQTAGAPDVAPAVTTGGATVAPQNAGAPNVAPAVTTGGAIAATPGDFGVSPGAIGSQALHTSGAPSVAPAVTTGGATPTLGEAPAPSVSPAVTTGGATPTLGEAPAPSVSPAVTTGGAGVQPTAPVQATGGAPSSTSIPTPTAEEAALLAAAGLAITAAGFAAAGRRRGPTLPA